MWYIFQKLMNVLHVDHTADFFILFLFSQVIMPCKTRIRFKVFSATMVCRCCCSGNNSEHLTKGYGIQKFTKAPLAFVRKRIQNLSSALLQHKT